MAFLRNVQRLMVEGSFTATYKFALLQALADLAVERGDDTNAELNLPTRDIAEAMIRLYWRQALPYPGIGGAAVLRQNSGGQAEIISRVLRARSVAEGSLVVAQSRPRDWERLVQSVDGILREMPLWRLQLVASERLDFLYPHDPGVSAIQLRPGVTYCLRAFHGLISELVRGAWTRFIRRQNAGQIGEAADLAGFLFGNERANLSRLVPLLIDLQRGECFYCRRRLRGPGEVDHFIPWSRYPIDLGHNVSAHVGMPAA
ncbi:MAG: HNH endonuclease [Solirubrobacterales bacterium]|nr:HNH endonuclease [Solirubrobacterales bacterium]